MNPFARQFGRNLSAARGRAGISQEELGVRADLHRTEVSQLERGLRVPRLDTIAKVAASLEVPPEQFFEGIGWRPGSVRRGGFKPSPGPTGSGAGQAR